MSELLHLFLLAFLGSIIALAGGAIFLFSRRWSKVLEVNAIPFAAGVLITVSLLGLLPESVELIGENAFLVILASFFACYLFEHMLFRIHHHEDHLHGHYHKSSTPLVLVGDTIHNFIDGIAIAASFFVNPGLGLVTAFSTFLHEVPHEVGDFGILLKAGWKKRDILLVNMISASMTIFGAFFVYFSTPSSDFIGVMLGVAAGIFLYLGSIDFLPEVAEDQKSGLRPILALLIGVLIMVGTLMAVPHSHEEETHSHDSETHNEEHL